METSLSEYLKKFGPDLAAKIDQLAHPAFRPGDPWNPRLPLLKRDLLPAQGDAVMGLGRLLETRRSTNVTAEMGVGKTIISLAVTWINNKPSRTLVMCPSHLTGKWLREVMETIPNAKAKIISSIKDLSLLNTDTRPKRWEYYILSKEKAKLGYAWKPMVRIKNGHPQCPECHKTVLDHLEDIASPSWLARAKRFCKYCGEPLWSADGTRFRRYPLAKYIKKRLNNYFDFFIADECHQYKAQSAQGAAYGILAAACKNTISLTGTLAGGYADDLFLLIARTDHTALRQHNLGFNDLKKFTEIYGITEKITKEFSDTRDNDRSLGKKTTTRIRRRPGISPLVFSDYLSGSTVFLRLSDVATELPPFEEITHRVHMTSEQNKSYQKMESELKDAMKKKSGRAFGAYMNVLLAWPDRPYDFDPVIDTDNNVHVTIPSLSANQTLPKEERLMEIVRNEIDSGRNVFIFCTYTGKLDVTSRIISMLENAKIPAALLTTKVKPDKREKWLQDQVNKGIKVMVGNPRLVETGLDLLDFPSLVFLQTGYSIYTLRQASRRSWRIGQKKSVKVHYLYYAGTLQDKALSLMGQKLESSLALEGEFSEDGLAALASGDDMSTALAKALAGKIQVKTVETVWASINKRKKTSLNNAGPAPVIPLPTKQVQESKPNPPMQQLALFG